MALVSIVVPVYNEQDNIKELHRRVVAAMGQAGEDWEMLLVDDGSHDDSIGAIRDLCEKDERVKGFRFSRNFGQYAAVTAGIDNAKGDAIIIMDADLQEPPSLIPKLIKEWKSGYKAVYTTATKRKDSFLRQIFGLFFYKIFGNIFKLGDVQNVSEMRLVDREVVKSFKRLTEKPRYLKGLFFWLGYKSIFVEYEKQERAAGKSNYTFRKLIRLTFDGIFSFSFLPLRVITYSGLTVLLLSICYVFIGLILNLFSQKLFSLIVFLVLFIGGIQTISLGILGEYIERIYDETRKRPLYIIEESYNLEPVAEK